MKNTVLIVMVGLPGSGKSTWIKKNARPEDVIISRDEIRFSLVKEGEPYFSKEKEVYREFVRRIYEAMAQGVERIYIDQTSLNVGARMKLMWRLAASEHYKNYDVIFSVIDVDVEKAIARNENRKGTRAYVPPERIYEMSKGFKCPTIGEITTNHYCYFGSNQSFKMWIIRDGWTRIVDLTHRSKAKDVIVSNDLCNK